MNDTVAILKALGDENRLRIVMMLRERSMCVCELDNVLDIALSTISAHLKTLKYAGLIVDEKEGRWMNYHYKPADTVRSLVDRVAEAVMSDPRIVKDLQRIKEISKESCSLG